MTEESTERTEQGKLVKILEKVRKLVAKAEHDGTPPAEAQLCREMADALMLKYTIDEAMVDADRPTGFKAKPIYIEIVIGGGPLYGYLGWLAQRVAKHCRCKVRTGTRYSREDGGYMGKVYGFESDVRFFEMLYTTLRLHMLGALRPKVNPDESDEDNAYRLHNAGYNWLEIAEMYGWRKATSYRVREAGLDPWDIKVPYYHTETEEIRPATYVGGLYKRAYLRAVKARGERPVTIAANGSETYRHSAVEGYTNRLNVRFGQQEREMNRVAGENGAVVLKSRAETLEDFWREDNQGLYTRCPRCDKLSSNPYKCEYCGQFIADPPEMASECKKCKAAKSGYCRDHALRAYRPTPHNRAGYAAGTAHADSADLLGTRRAGGSDRRPLA